jgi:hypothetical protein
MDDLHQGYRRARHKNIRGVGSGEELARHGVAASGVTYLGCRSDCLPFPYTVVTVTDAHTEA